MKKFDADAALHIARVGGEEGESPVANFALVAINPRRYMEMQVLGVYSTMRRAELAKGIFLNDRDTYLQIVKVNHPVVNSTILFDIYEELVYVGTFGDANDLFSVINVTVKNYNFEAINTIYVENHYFGYFRKLGAVEHFLELLSLNHPKVYLSVAKKRVCYLEMYL